MSSELQGAALNRVNTYNFLDKGVNAKKVWKLMWNLSVDDIKNITTEYIANYTALVDEICAIPKNKQIYATTILRLDQYVAQNHFKLNCAIFLQNVIDDEDIQNASISAENAISIFLVELFMRKDLYAVAKHVYKNQKETLHGEDLRYLKDVLRTFERNGLKLDDHSYNRIKELNQQLTVLCTEFTTNIAKDNTTIMLTRDELDGLSDAYIDSLDKQDDLFIVTSKYPHIFPILENAKLESTRKKIYHMYSTRCPENTSILFNILTIRMEIANLLGYDNWAEYMLKLNMAKDTNTVDVFLTDLAEKLKPLRNKEIDMLMTRKQGMLEHYDWRYYLEMDKSEKYNIDTAAIKEYFPLDHILQHIFAYFGELLNVNFEKTDYPSWHDEVSEYEVYNRTDSRILGKIYMDMFPRPNKYNHAACFPLKYTIKSDPYGIVAIVCNFTPPTDDYPALLTHEEVETFFHEFGHAMHNLCSDTKYCEYSGTQTERDFVEMPSQMVENWCWEFSTLKRLGIHYKTKKPMPDGMIAKLIATRYVGSGLINCRQLEFAIIDLLLHTKIVVNETDMLNIADKVAAEIFGIPNMENTFKLATFGHITGGYDAQYYGYMWSKVYADDIYMQIKTDKKAHESYRKLVLAPGGAIDGYDILDQYLGRHADNRAFLKNLGL